MNWKGDDDNKKSKVPVLSIALIAVAIWAAVILIIWEVGY